MVTAMQEPVALLASATDQERAESYRAPRLKLTYDARTGLTAGEINATRSWGDDGVGRLSSPVSPVQRLNRLCVMSVPSSGTLTTWKR